jgi:DNA-binding GntR family transcriptional regulator
LYARGVSRIFPPLAPIPTASSAVAARIREAIIGGMLHPGERLKEEQLARELGTSRTPVREALRMLQSEGLIVALPNRGAVVRSYRLAELEEMYDLRELLEGHAARRAAERITTDEVAELSASCDRFAELITGADLPSLVEENAFFHGTILRASDSERLTAMVQEVISLPLVYRSYIWYSPEQAQASYGFHRRLVKALDGRDAPRAEQVMREHVSAARSVLVAHIEDVAPAEASG